MAVKIVAHNCALSSLAEVLRESALSTSIQHPNVVNTLSRPDRSSGAELLCKPVSAPCDIATSMLSLPFLKNCKGRGCRGFWNLRHAMCYLAGTAHI